MLFIYLFFNSLFIAHINSIWGLMKYSSIQFHLWSCPSWNSLDEMLHSSSSSMWSFSRFNFDDRTHKEFNLYPVLLHNYQKHVLPSSSDALNHFQRKHLSILDPCSSAWWQNFYRTCSRLLTSGPWWPTCIKGLEAESRLHNHCRRTSTTVHQPPA